MNRWSRIVCSFIAVSGMCVPAIAGDAPAPGPKAGSVTALLPVAHVSRVVNKANVTKDAAKGDDVYWNDVVRTDKGGRARITLNDQSILSLGSQAELGFRLVLPSGQAVVAVARIADLGAPNGMLLFRADDEIRDHDQEFEDAGYGFSVVDEPRPDEEFDLTAFQEMFRDWGWSGRLGAKPAWMR